MSQAKDILNNIKHRLPGRVNIYPAINRAIRLVSKRLFYNKSNLVLGSLSVSILADASTGTLPDDFWGLLDKPYENGETYLLEPVPNQLTELQYTDDSKPKYYKIIDTTLEIFPGTSSNTTINGDYWKKPTAITKPTDTIPFSELFDDVIEEYVIHSFITGSTTGQPQDISLMSNFVNQQVDSIAPYIANTAPKRIQDSFHLDALVDGSDWGVFNG